MTIATDILDGVADAVAELGKSATLRHITYGDWIDSTKPSKGKVTTVNDYTVQIIISDYDAEAVDGSIIQRGDKQVILSLGDIMTDPPDPVPPAEPDAPVSATIVPSVNDLIIDGSVTWNVINVSTQEVNGTPVVSVLQVRK